MYVLNQARNALSSSIPVVLTKKMIFTLRRKRHLSNWQTWKGKLVKLYARLKQNAAFFFSEAKRKSENKRQIPFKAAFHISVTASENATHSQYNSNMNFKIASCFLGVMENEGQSIAVTWKSDIYTHLRTLEPIKHPPCCVLSPPEWYTMTKSSGSFNAYLLSRGILTYRSCALKSCITMFHR